MVMMKSISRHIPQRTCVACRQVKPKREMTRLVRVSGGAIEVDTSGRKPGRGAYLCRNIECWRAGLMSSRLDYTLRTTITSENREWLMNHSKEFVGE
ncbi:MAG: YlxR family protein [Dehalococcoidales bacterium]|nr:YlxR family protein [Dehalococcoidales bacterium]